MIMVYIERIEIMTEIKEVFECSGFTVRLLHKDRIETFVTLSYELTRLFCLEQESLEEARRDYRTICDTVRNVIMCLKDKDKKPKEDDA